MTITLVHTLRPDGLPYLKHVYADSQQGMCGSMPYEGQVAPALADGQAYPGCPECMDIFMDQVQEHGMAMIKALDEERVTLREALRSLQDLDLEDSMDRVRMAVNLSLMVSSLTVEVEADHD